MRMRLLLPAIVLSALALIMPVHGWAATAPAIAPPAEKIEIAHMTGRWYEVARLPNKPQKDCQGGTSDWVKTGDGYSVVQTCHHGTVSGPTTEWKAKAKVIDPRTNARFKMSFFGGMISQEYWVLDHRAEQGWLILGTPGGKYLWLMSQRPSLSQSMKAQAVSRIKQLGYDATRLEYPQTARN